MALNFPSNPSEGQSYEAEGKSFQYIDGGWAVLATDGGSALFKETFITANGNFVPDPNTVSFEVEVIGAGGGSGGADGQGSGTAAVGGGGGGGAYCSRLVTGPLEASYAVVVGAGGTNGAGNGATDGGDGGLSSFIGGSINMSAPGGLGGTGRIADGTNMNGATGGGPTAAATGGTFNLAGTFGKKGQANSGQTYMLGDGGAGPMGYGTGGRCPQTNSATNVGGEAGIGYGCGAGGGFTRGVTGNSAGQVGRGGLVRVREYKDFPATGGAFYFEEFNDPAGLKSWRIIGNTLECWGADAGASAELMVPFPKTFALKPAITTASRSGATSGAPRSVQVSAVEVDSFTFRPYNNVGDLVGVTCRWHAIGEWDGIS